MFPTMQIEARHINTMLHGLRGIVPQTSGPTVMIASPRADTARNMCAKNPTMF